VAQDQIHKAQKSQKENYDRNAAPSKVHVGDQVFVYTPAEKTGKAYKFACPYMGPYRVLELYNNGASVKLISKPNDSPIRVALNQVRLCLDEIKDLEEDGDQAQSKSQVESEVDHTHTKGAEQDQPELSKNPIDKPEDGVWTGRLRSHVKNT